MTLATTLSDDERSTALLQALGFDRLSPGQRELALNIANRYELDPLLKHLVMIEGKPYITRDGLLHVAHKSGVFDGIEVTDPVLEGGFWRARATVYRKDMRPFTYPGRYPERGQNSRYGPEMAIKVAEVMTLRRAFDVAAPTVEEQWDVDGEVVEKPAEEPKTLAERVAAKIATVETPIETGETYDQTNDVDVEPVADATAGVDQPEITESAEDESGDESDPTTVSEPSPETTGSSDVPVGVPGQFDGVPVEIVDDDGGIPPVSPLRDPDEDGPSLEEFAEILKDVDKATVKRVAKRLFPNASKFADLKPGELGLIIDTIAAEEESETTEYQTPTVANGGIVVCGNESPLSGATCTLDAGHSGVHRAGLKESW